mmetsp:Transcript_23983/g.66627  ORF Transcript_23983/g.66627 Transcript_23983/m.66627 type:complete len:188 (-) Transcript_23983:415-978(-)
MSEATWRAQPTTAGRSVFSQYKPDHVKQWQATEDRRQQKGVFGTQPRDETDHLTLYRPSLAQPVGAQPYVERKHNSNAKSLSELRTLLAPFDTDVPTAASHDMNDVNVLRAPLDKGIHPCEGKRVYSPSYVHHHHFGWSPPMIQPRGKHIREPGPQTVPIDPSGAIRSMDYCNKVSGKLSVMSSRRP